MVTGAHSDLTIVVDGHRTTAHPGEVVSLGRDPASTIVLPDETVSRRHAELRLRSGCWELRDLGSTNGTWVHDTRVDHLDVDGPIEIHLGRPGEGVTVVLQPTEAEDDGPNLDATSAVPVVTPVPPPDGPDATPTPGPPDPEIGTSASGVVQCTNCAAFSPLGTEWCRCGAYLPHDGVVMGEATTTAVSMSLAADEATVEPGDEAELVLTLHNTGGVVDRFTVRIDGAAAAWSVADPDAVSLFPGSTATTRLVFRPPRNSSCAAGPTPFRVVAVSHTDDQMQAVAEGTVTVSPFHDLTARLVPEISSQSGAVHHVELENRGNARVALRLEARDPAEALTFVFEPADPNLDRGVAERVPMTVTLRAPEDEETAGTFPFQVIVHPTVGDDLTLDGRLQLEAEEVEPPPPPKPVVVKTPKAPGWRPEIHLLAIIGALLVIVGSGLDWTDGLDAGGVPFAFLIDGSSTDGPPIGPLLVLGGMGAIVLSLFRRTAGVRRIGGLVAIAVVGAFVAQVVLQDGGAVVDTVPLFREGAYATAVGGLLLVLSS